MGLFSRRKRSGWPGPDGLVHLVMRDDTPDNNILGVFESQAEADSFADEILGLFPDGVIILPVFAAGWRYDGGRSDYTRNAPNLP